MGLLKEKLVCPTFIINIISLGCNLFAIGSWPQFYAHKDYFSADWCSVFHGYSVLCHDSHDYVCGTDSSVNQCKLKPWFCPQELVSFRCEHHEAGRLFLTYAEWTSPPALSFAGCLHRKLGLSVYLCLLNSGGEEERETRGGREGMQPCEETNRKSKKR